MPAFVHIDFKGLPLTPSYLLARFAELHDAGASGVVLEWEDCLPLSGSLAGYASAHAYTAAEVQRVPDCRADEQCAGAPADPPERPSS